MSRSHLKLMSHAALALVAGGAALSWNGNISTPFQPFSSRLEARVGRPATPMSYAGVARRTTRRAVAAGAATAAAAGTYYYYNARPGCVQVVNSYGQIVYRCP
jgi:hypothetical protein